MIKSADDDAIRWAQVEGIPLHRIEHVVGFGNDMSLSVWLFYERDSQVTSCAQTGESERLSTRYRGALAGAGYPQDLLSAIGFLFDSHENVQAHYEGSYFYRLR